MMNRPKRYEGGDLTIEAPQLSPQNNLILRKANQFDHRQTTLSTQRYNNDMVCNLSLGLGANARSDINVFVNKCLEPGSYSTTQYMGTCRTWRRWHSNTEDARARTHPTVRISPYGSAVMFRSAELLERSNCLSGQYYHSCNIFFTLGPQIQQSVDMFG